MAFPRAQRFTEKIVNGPSPTTYSPKPLAEKKDFYTFPREERWKTPSKYENEKRLSKSPMTRSCGSLSSLRFMYSAISRPSPQECNTRQLGEQQVSLWRTEDQIGTYKCTAKKRLDLNDNQLTVFDGAPLNCRTIREEPSPTKCFLLKSEKQGKSPEPVSDYKKPSLWNTKQKSDGKINYGFSRTSAPVHISAKDERRLKLENQVSQLLLRTKCQQAEVDSLRRCQLEQSREIEKLKMTQLSKLGALVNVHDRKLREIHTLVKEQNELISSTRYQLAVEVHAIRLKKCEKKQSNNL